MSGPLTLAVLRNPEAHARIRHAIETAIETRADQRASFGVAEVTVSIAPRTAPPEGLNLGVEIWRAHDGRKWEKGIPLYGTIVDRVLVSAVVVVTYLAVLAILDGKDPAEDDEPIPPRPAA